MNPPQQEPQRPDCGACEVPKLRDAHPDEYRETVKQHCKRCKTRYRVRDWRTRNPEKSKEVNQRSAAKPEYKAKRAQYQRERMKTPAFLARRAVAKAIRNGELTKPDHCERCDHTNIQAHHPDYSRPLDVVWLCRTHHNEADRERRLREQLAGLSSRDEDDAGGASSLENLSDTPLQQALDPEGPSTESNPTRQDHDPQTPDP